MESNTSDAELNYADLRNKNIVEKTKGNYTGRIKLFLKWLRDHYPVCFSVDDDEDGIDEESFDNNFVSSSLNSKMLEEWLTETLYHKKGKNKGMLKSKSSSDGNRAALVWFCKKHNINIDSFKVQSMEFIKGVKNQRAQMKECGQLEAKEGKDVLTIEGYRSVCLIAIESTHYSAFLFVVLAWNLMTRSVTTSALRISHFSWGGDCIRRVNWGGKHKSDQSGELGSTSYAAQVRHIYSNPINPRLCCFLALGIWMLAVNRAEADSVLFTKEEEETSFNNWLKSTFAALTDAEKMDLGFNYGDYSSHSTRKGSTSYACSLAGKMINFIFYIIRIFYRVCIYTLCI